jgi:hypothetical protein
LKTAIHKEKKTTLRLTQTHHHHQDCHLNANSKDRHHPSPRRDREPPPQQAEQRDRDWIAANVGKVRYDSLKILELREGATEGEVKAAYMSNVQNLPHRQAQLRIHWYV